MFEQMSTTDILILVGMLVFLYMMLYPQLQMHAARRKRLAKIHEVLSRCQVERGIHHVGTRIAQGASNLGGFFSLRMFKAVS